MITWHPSRSVIEQTNIFKEWTKLGFSTYEEYYNWSITEKDAFCHSIENYFELKWDKLYDKIVQANNSMSDDQFFVGGKINLVDFALKRLPVSHEPFIYFENEKSELKMQTAENWREDIYKMAAFLQSNEFKKGDTVLFYTPMIPEMTVVFFAVTMLGGVCCPVFSGFKKESVKVRKETVGANWIFTVEETNRKGKRISLVDELREILDYEKDRCIVVYQSDKTENSSYIYDYKHIIANSDGNALQIPVLDANDTSLVLFTSGTTGKPKAIMHSQLGFSLKAAWDAYIGWDVKKGDCIFWYTDLGWMMGPFILWSSLLNRAKLVLFEGVIDTHSPGPLFELLQNYDITHAGISPGLVRSFSSELRNRKEKESVPKLKSIGATGEPWNDVHWDLFSHYLSESGFPIFNYSGGTEISGGIFANIAALPQTTSGFNIALPGMSVMIKYENENDEKGELVITSSWLGMTKGFYTNQESFKETYFRENDYWYHGDYVEKKEGYYFIRGRSDDTINVNGKRIGPQEIETVLCLHKNVIESAVISIPYADKGDASIAFVVCETSVSEEVLLLLIDEQIGKSFRPYRIFNISELPKTRNGKVMRRIIKKAFLHEDLGDTSALVNESCLREIQNCRVEEKETHS